MCMYVCMRRLNVKESTLGREFPQNLLHTLISKFMKQLLGKLSTCLCVRNKLHSYFVCLRVCVCICSYEEYPQVRGKQIAANKLAANKFAENKFVEKLRGKKIAAKKLRQANPTPIQIL